MLFIRSILLLQQSFALCNQFDPRGDFVGGGAAARDEFFPAGIFFGPFLESALAEEILVIEAEFFQTSAGDVGQFEFALFGSYAGEFTIADL